MTTFHVQSIGSGTIGTSSMSRCSRLCLLLSKISISNLVGLELCLVSGVTFGDIGCMGSVQVEQVSIKEFEPVLNLFTTLLCGLSRMGIELEERLKDEFLEVRGESQMSVSKFDTFGLDGLKGLAQGSTVVPEEAIQLF